MINSESPVEFILMQLSEVVSTFFIKCKKLDIHGILGEMSLKGVNKMLIKYLWWSLNSHSVGDIPHDACIPVA